MNVERGKLYDPWMHADHLGVAVVEDRLRGDLWGEYRHRDGLIVLRRGMTRREARCVLAHEIMHAVAGDTPTRLGYLHRARERRADLSAALLLVCEREYAEAELLYGPHDTYLAAELDVMPEVLVDWRKAMRAAGVAV